jgi:hypothetical protein
MYGFDTLWYHMPLAASFVQSASTTGLHFTDPLYLNWFYPANSELVHATGILFYDRDILSPLINMAWLALALLAAWCMGRPYGVAPLSLLAVAALMGAHSLEVGQPGDAKNDIVGIALLLASVALLLQASRRTSPSGEGTGGGPPSDAQSGADKRKTETTRAERRRLSGGGPPPIPQPAPLAVAGLAAGLAIGTKLDLLAAVALLTIAVITLAPATARLTTTAWFALPLLATGAYWYLRNLLSAGNPLPWIKHLGPIGLPHPARPIEGRAPFTVAHYLFDSRIYNDYFFPGLHKGFGRGWPVLLALALAGMALAAIRGTRTLRMVGLFALLASVAYLFTPLSASGPEGSPVGFALNLRYLAPALAVGLALLPIALAGRRAGASTARFDLRRDLPVVGLIAVFALLIFLDDKPRAIPNSLYTSGALVLAFVLVVFPFGLYLLGRRGGSARALPLFAAAVAALAIAAVGWPESRNYLRHRYTLTPYSSFHLDRAYQWARDQHQRRIGLAGTTIAFFQYGLYGADLSNRVSYVGLRTPHGGMAPYTDCAAWRGAVNDGGYEYVVTSPFLNQNDGTRPIPSPERDWLRGDPAAQLVLRDASTAVFRIAGRLDPAGCAGLGSRSRIALDSLNPPAPPPSPG